MAVLDERWSLLVIRELGAGRQHFNELRRGIPTMSPTLLSKRLHELVGTRLVERHVDRLDVRYVLTPAGEELLPIIAALGDWGRRWSAEPGDGELDPWVARSA
jgi:DNA-binding HxlR family transcriptional regulator